MKKLRSVLLLATTIFLIVGCESDRLESLPKGDRLFFLSSYTIEKDDNGEEEKIFDGLANILYDCGGGEKLTSAKGSFKFEEGQDCIFYTLDNNMSTTGKGDELFIKDEIKRGVEGINYSCISGIDSETDEDGRFVFESSYSDDDRVGDRCTFFLSDLY